MTPEPPLRLGVLGLGFMGSTHLKALRALTGVKLAAVCSNVDQELTGDLTAVRGNFGGQGERFDFSSLKRYRDVPSILADPEIDAVDVCLPTNLHTAVVLDALAAGKHVLVEKPMALDAASAGRMVEAARRADRVLMTAQVLRFRPDYMALREAVRSGALGAVRSASFRRRCATPEWGGWLKDPARSGGGAFDLLIHDADMVMHVFGMPEAVAATGVAPADGSIDLINAQLFYRGGPVVSVTGGWHGPGGLPFSMGYTATFDGGTIDFESGRHPATLYPAEGGERELAEGECDTYAAEIGYFAECCRERREPEICPPQESAHAVGLMRLMLEARERNGEKMACRI